MANYNQTHRTEGRRRSGLTLEILANHNFDYIKTILKKKNDRDLLKLELNI